MLEYWIRGFLGLFLFGLIWIIINRLMPRFDKLLQRIPAGIVFLAIIIGLFGEVLAVWWLSTGIGWLGYLLIFIAAIISA